MPKVLPHDTVFLNLKQAVMSFDIGKGVRMMDWTGLREGQERGGKLPVTPQKRLARD